MSDPETLKVYADKAEEYATLVAGQTPTDPLLTSFIALFAKGSDVLDLGCGPGHAAHVMADAGLTVTATDAVPEMVARADSHPSVTARVATFDDIAGHAVYDGIWANFCLLHAPRADMPRHLAALHTALRPNGVLHIALKTGAGEQRDPIGRLYTYYTDAELTDLLNTAGFTVTNRTTGRDIGLDGVPANWIALRAYG
jgi:2-polyprenyl-3-methyl-5-hydroxy-6-metoxy-1,4-benzoquinol methylase